MKNLLDVPSEHHDIYRRAANTWRDKVVGGALLTLVGVVVVVPAEIGDIKEFVALGAVTALSGAGIVGYGAAELAAASKELTERTASTNLNN